jgi:hypothetical protein
VEKRRELVDASVINVGQAAAQTLSVGAGGLPGGHAQVHQGIIGLLFHGTAARALLKMGFPLHYDRRAPSREADRRLLRVAEEYGLVSTGNGWIGEYRRTGGKSKGSSP